MRIELTVALIAAISGLLAPLLSNFLQRSGFAQRAKEMEVLEKQSQVIARLLSLEAQLSDQKRELLRKELDYIAHDVVGERLRERGAAVAHIERLSWLRRSLLIYEQPSMRASVYRYLFWFCCFVSVGGVASIAIYDPTIFWEGVPGAVIYLIIGVAFRQASIRQRKRMQANAEGAAEDHSAGV